MKAGRELDATIHEKIFGRCGHVLAVYKKDNRDWSDDYTNYRCKKCKTETFRGLAYREGMTVYPHYSTKISDAWLVVEKLDKSRNFLYVSNVASGWKCNIEADRWYAVAETASLAICLAALKAVGADVDVNG